jgi:iron complex outermembrane receptor protein
MKNLLILLLSILGPITSIAQGIKGKITDEKDGSALPGVSILVQSTNNGTVTDGDGNYTINIAEGSYNIVVSFIGYTPQIIPAVVNSRSRYYAECVDGGILGSTKRNRGHRLPERRPLPH